MNTMDRILNIVRLMTLAIQYLFCVICKHRLKCYLGSLTRLSTPS